MTTETDPRSEMLAPATIRTLLGKHLGADNAARVVKALEPQPVPQPSATGWQRPGRFTQRWFKSALAAIERRCIGFDAAQASQTGAGMARFPLSLLSDRHYVLQLRYPLGPVMRIAEFIIDLEQDPPTVIVLEGKAKPFHDLLAARRDVVASRANSAERVADFARIFCGYLEGNDSKLFIPCESVDFLAGRYLGDPPPKLAEHARCWERLTKPDGAKLDGSVAHLIHGAMLYDAHLFLVQLLVTLPDASGTADRNPVRTFTMIEDRILTLQGNGHSGEPIVPAMRNPLTNAVFPMRGAFLPEQGAMWG